MICMDITLVGKKVIVTGGSRGIGLGIVKLFLENGADVEIWGLNEERGQAVIESLTGLGGEVSFARVDVSHNGGVKDCVQKFLDKHNKIDILVNNAGITRDNLLMRMSEDDWQSVISTNLTSLYYTCSSVIRHMIKARSGSIINVASIVAKIGSAGQTNYAAAKAGIIAFTKSLAKEVAARNIRVNCLAPGFIETDMTSVLNDNLKAEWLKSIPLGRAGTPEDVARVALFLASQLSSYMTAQTLVVDGGLTY
ncbi:3-oxoacyl-[acyl-carrier-protein] reductase FabG [Chlamydia pneumoniae]|nr:3-oxoacyl-[acyl-carrier-protein] reductase FabG [Chlamydia pneumoniae]CRI39045.1 3-oxoacyl-[acyl-carrier-protein] reductase FabG [Chlamydia pneumoniae]CRI44641.1 3-oxoacyl-[acyl-carrier-protein] reductase FabG [Chlamydia pneumoniae]CRI45772.1 3-oxoacyl-[acyl-carrier-protein] reductase FabG [Chlamydia pneumoniae]CRI48066.1 3-oxoacyl-[acyl-carrier-protein] reductase FabG [Chlamydia pneumoniae]